MFSKKRHRHEGRGAIRTETSQLRLTYSDGQTTEVTLTLVRRERRSLSLTVLNTRHIRLAVPLNFSQREILNFLSSKKHWLAKALASGFPPPPLTEEESRCWRQKTQQRALAFLQSYTGKQPARLSVRHQKTRWGSCSSNGTISLNLNAARLDDELFAYLMIHELCHLYEMNHSPAFWARVETILPDYPMLRARLRKIPLR